MDAHGKLTQVLLVNVPQNNRCTVADRSRSVRRIPDRTRISAKVRGCPAKTYQVTVTVSPAFQTVVASGEVILGTNTSRAARGAAATSWATAPRKKVATAANFIVVFQRRESSNVQLRGWKVGAKNDEASEGLSVLSLYLLRVHRRPWRAEAGPLSHEK